MRRLLAPLAVLVLVAPAPTLACGGLFAESPDQVADGTDFNMVLSVGAAKTTFYDTIKYTGDAKKFVWVLPTPTLPEKPVIVGEELFSWLEEATQPRVFPPANASDDSSFGCGSSDASRGTETNGLAGDQVTVFQTGTVGGYEFATVASTDPGALLGWLTTNGYHVPEYMKPLIQWYVDKGWYFTAMKLQASATVRQLAPVGLTYPGQHPVVPLHLMLMGGTAKVNITVWVFADKRYQPTNFDVATIPDARLRWYSSEGRSNYRDLFHQLIAERMGKAFIVEYADFPYEPYGTANDDYKALTVGLARPYLTRLRTTIDQAWLTADLQLAVAADQTTVSRDHRLTAEQVVSSPAGGALVGLAWLLLALGVRRRARRDA